MRHVVCLSLVLICLSALAVGCSKTQEPLAGSPPPGPPPTSKKAGPVTVTGS